jgi:hypothetical protein
VNQKGKRPLATAAKLLLVATAIIACLHLVGQYTLGRMLSRHAMLTAELWSRTVLDNRSGPLAERLEQSGGELRRALDLVHIDALALVSPTNGIRPAVRGADAAAPDLQEVVVSRAGRRASPATAGSGA